MRVENERFQRLRRISGRRRNFLHDLLENFLDADPGFGRSQDRFARIETDDVLDLLLHPFRICAGQVDLVDDRQNLQVVVERQVHVSQCLRFDPLRRVNDKQGAFAGGQTAGYFVREIDVSRRIDQIQYIFLAVVGAVVQAYGLQLDRNAPFPLQIHLVEHLILHLAGCQRAGKFQDPVGQRRFPVIDMGDNAEISNFLLSGLDIHRQQNLTKLAFCTILFIIAVVGSCINARKFRAVSCLRAPTALQRSPPACAITSASPQTKKQWRGCRDRR